MIKAAIKGIEVYLPETIMSNESLSEDFRHWTPEKILDKTGIAERRISGPDECASDMAEQSAKRLFDSGVCCPEEIEYIMLCTQSPDYLLPATACILQDKLGIPKTAGALDFNLGCSGYVYGLSLVKGLIETGQVNNVLLITSETLSKYFDPKDASVRFIFGDAAAATFIQGIESDKDHIGPFVFGTDGSGRDKLIVKNGAARNPLGAESANAIFSMAGPHVFTFTIETVPDAIDRVLNDAGLSKDDIDMFVFHQANEFMLEHLRKSTKIDSDKFCIDIKETGNTVSATIPIALSNLFRAGSVKSGDTIMLVGFGVGYSWAATICRIP